MPLVFSPHRESRPQIYALSGMAVSRRGACPWAENGHELDPNCRSQPTVSALLAVHPDWGVVALPLWSGRTCE
jgi:hypothetical protein